MRELRDMWGNTRMVVLTAMCASLYAAVLIPFMIGGLGLQILLHLWRLMANR
jgi:hypothetical protein